MTKTCSNCDGTGEEINPSYDDYAPAMIRCTACFGGGKVGRKSKTQLAEKE